MCKSNQVNQVNGGGLDFWPAGVGGRTAVGPTGDDTALQKIFMCSSEEEPGARSASADFIVDSTNSNEGNGGESSKHPQFTRSGGSVKLRSSISR